MGETTGLRQLIHLEQEFYEGQLRAAAFLELHLQIAQAAAAAMNLAGLPAFELDTSELAAVPTPGFAKDESAPDVARLLRQVRKSFTPERSARRIARFLLSGYERSQQPERYARHDRRAYAERALEPVEKGYRRTLALVQAIPDGIRADLILAKVRIGEILAAFVLGTGTRAPEPVVRSPAAA